MQIVYALDLFQENYDEMSHIMRKLVLPYGNNKDADQPGHLHCLISTFVFAAWIV